MANGPLTPEQLQAVAAAKVEQAFAEKQVADAVGDSVKALEAEKKLIEARIALLEEMSSREDERIAQFRETIGGIDEEIKKQKELQEVEKKSKKIKDELTKASKKLFNVVKDVALSYDAQRSALAKLLPTQSKYNKELALVMRTGGEAALTFSEAAKGFNILAQNFIGFSEVSSASRKSLALVAAGFEQFGFQGFSENLNLATFSMGMNAKEAQQLNLNLVATAGALQLPPNVIMKEFLPAMKTLTQYTNQEAIKVFKNLAGQSKATGIAINELMGIVGKFDTFQGAAEAAGRFNAILGGDYLNSVKLLSATEDERIQMIKEGFKLSGRQFSDLNRFEKRSVALSLGIKDVAQAQALLGSESENLRMMEERARKAGMTVDEFRKSQEAQRSIQEKLNILYQKFIPLFSGVVDFLNKGIAAVTKAADSWSNFGKMILGATVVVGKFLGSMKLLKFGLAKLGVGKLLGGLFGGTFAAMGSILVVVAKGIAVAAVLLAGVGLAFMAAGAGISAFASSMKNIQELDASKISSNMYKMGKAAALTAPVAAAGGLVTGALGLIGGAIGGATRALTGAGAGGQQINLTITHNDVGKTNESVKQSFKDLGMRVKTLETKQAKVAKAKA